MSISFRIHIIRKESWLFTQTSSQVRFRVESSRIYEEMKGPFNLYEVIQIKKFKFDTVFQFEDTFIVVLLDSNNSKRKCSQFSQSFEELCFLYLKVTIDLNFWILLSVLFEVD